MLDILPHWKSCKGFLGVIDLFFNKRIINSWKIRSWIWNVLRSIEFFKEGFVYEISLIFIERLIRWAMNPFLDLYTEDPPLIFLSYSASSRIKFKRILSFKIALFKSVFSGSVRAVSMILEISLWRRLFMGYSLIKLRRMLKKLSVFPTISFVLRMFSFNINLKISMIFILPVPILGLIAVLTFNFSQLFWMKCSRSFLNSSKTASSSGKTRGTLVR